MWGNAYQIVQIPFHFMGMDLYAKDAHMKNRPLEFERISPLFLLPCAILFAKLLHFAFLKGFCKTVTSSQFPVCPHTVTLCNTFMASPCMYDRGLQRTKELFSFPVLEMYIAMDWLHLPE